ncbi:uncharacterized protein UV8b_00310 [Ustilaginoidea virens]|uniref:TPR domain-containing protein n=1 Tax=Ustilaginoidea virens TaxID=1159556 RepID=A0A1B5L120_USTVR|nr:uncharacterized protein UV8b_00310 [Ustilaginoidea virens]QUC16069.1 hypothetical protein UV8b_00310 [Ustilaginoidea virens]GAO17105.1 hypothetical protein UVI_02026380 [Ustilaginoidea virens]
MSVSAIAAFRPVPTRCTRLAATGLLTVRLRAPAASLTLRAVISLPACQRRFESQPRPPGQPPASPATFRQFVRRSLRVSLRNLFFALSPRGIRSAYTDSPAQTSLSVIVLALLTVVFAIVLRSFFLAFYNPQFSRYPEPVANSLRLAIYYTNYKPDPQLALKYYRRAMEQVREAGLDPFSDEVLGIRLQVSAWLLKVESYKASIDVLESVLHDCRTWVDTMERSASVPDGTATAAGARASSTSGGAATERAAAAPPAAHAQGPDGQAQDAGPDVETLWRKRQRLLAKAVGIAVKLGQVYADEHVMEPEKSSDRLVWAVETSLKELQRRRARGPRPGEHDWLSPAELGAVLEALGRDYERRSQFQLAVPLFFQALQLCDSPCHGAVIMNNLAACFAQQQPVLAAAAAAAAAAPAPADLPRTREDCLEAAASWASNAYAHGTHVPAAQRTAECDEACAVALCNWGDVAALQGNKELARQKYQQCIDMGRKLDFAAAVSKAQEGLANLTTAPGAEA